jgi:hypothetical protein
MKNNICFDVSVLISLNFFIRFYRMFFVYALSESAY